jgi:translation initiation factor eIF-2B subunit epsilon
MTIEGLFQEIILVESSASTVGDIMRELDRKAFLKSDFIVVHGDVVSNFSLAEALSVHQKRREKEKNAIMTVVVRNSGSQTEQTWPGAQEIAYDLENKRLLAYQKKGEDDIDLDPDVLGEFSDIEITANLIDPCIDICTPEVLALWSDNFDFQRPRNHFLHQVLKDYELNGKKIFLHLLDKPGQFAYRVQHLRSYDKISRYVLSRYSYPYCPEMNLLQSHDYVLSLPASRFTYIDRQNVTLPDLCRLGPNVAIGAQTTVGDCVTIRQSSIGVETTVGSNTVISDSYLWGNNVIGENTTISNAILGTGVQVGSNCTIEQGSLLGNNVVIADGVTVKAGTKITLWKRLSEEDHGILHALQTDPTVVGADGQGGVFEERKPGTLEDDPEAEDLLVEQANRLTSDKSFLGETIQSSEKKAAKEKADLAIRSRRADSDADSEMAMSAPPSPSHPSDSEFHHESSTALLTSLHRSDASSNMQVELNSSRLASNASEHAVRRAVSAAFGTYFVEKASTGSNVKETVERVIKEHRVLFTRIMFDKKDDEKPDQEDLLLCFQKSLLSPMEHRHDEGAIVKLVSGDTETAGTILLHLVSSLVALDVVEAEGVEAWWESPRSKEDANLAAVRERTKAVVDFLLQSDDEEESDEESDEE